MTQTINRHGKDGERRLRTSRITKRWYRPSMGKWHHRPIGISSKTAVMMVVTITGRRWMEGRRRALAWTPPAGTVWYLPKRQTGDGVWRNVDPCLLGSGDRTLDIAPVPGQRLCRTAQHRHTDGTAVRLIQIELTAACRQHRCRTKSSEESLNEKLELPGQANWWGTLPAA